MATLTTFQSRRRRKPLAMPEPPKEAEEVNEFDFTISPPRTRVPSALTPSGQDIDSGFSTPSTATPHTARSPSPFFAALSSGSLEYPSAEEFPEVEEGNDAGDGNYDTPTYSSKRPTPGAPKKRSFTGVSLVASAKRRKVKKIKTVKRRSSKSRPKVARTLKMGDITDDNATPADSKAQIMMKKLKLGMAIEDAIKKDPFVKAPLFARRSFVPGSTAKGMVKADVPVDWSTFKAVFFPKSKEQETQEEKQSAEAAEENKESKEGDESPMKAPRKMTPRVIRFDSEKEVWKTLGRVSIVRPFTLLTASGPTKIVPKLRGPITMTYHSRAKVMRVEYPLEV